MVGSDIGAGVQMVTKTTDAISWRNAYALLKGERLVTQNLIVGGGSIAAGVLGFAFQSLFAHNLRPADYGAVFAVITLITLLGLPATGFTLLMARETSRDRARGEIGLSATLLRHGNLTLLLLGAAIAAALAIASPAISKFFGAPPQLLLAAAVGVPFGLALPLLLGEFQGEQRFLELSVLLTSLAGLKLVAAIALVVFFGPIGVVAGISAASIAVYCAALWMLSAKLSINSDVEWWRPAIRYLGIVIPSTLALSLLLSADILLVKHFFNSTAAGQYSAVAALGRAIFWGAAAVSAVLFPKVVFGSTRGQRTLAVVGVSLALVTAGGLLGLALLSITSKWLLTAFAGSAYVSAAGYLPWYALGMTLLGGVSVLVAAHQSHGRPGFLAILLPLAALEPILIVLFHQTLIQVVQVVDVSMAIVAGGLALWYVVEERTRQFVLAPSHMSTEAGSPQLQASQ
jgi:O-antigen/teichoic acid export membrane protein